MRILVFSCAPARMRLAAHTLNTCAPAESAPRSRTRGCLASFVERALPADHARARRVEAAQRGRRQEWRPHH
eukprot:3996977-Pleurochrysis_carterae.AAC.1